MKTTIVNINSRKHLIHKINKRTKSKMSPNDWDENEGAKSKIDNVEQKNL
jgi:hypothetical protein